MERAMMTRQEIVFCHRPAGLLLSVFCVDCVVVSGVWNSDLSHASFLDVPSARDLPSLVSAMLQRSSTNLLFLLQKQSSDLAVTPHLTAGAFDVSFTPRPWHTQRAGPATLLAWLRSSLTESSE